MKKTLLLGSLFAVSAFAGAKVDWKPCDAEMKKFGCKGDDKAVWACLEKHDAELSASCQKSHAEADKQFKH